MNNEDIPKIWSFVTLEIENYHDASALYSIFFFFFFFFFLPPAQLRGDIEFYQGAFESYKTQLHQEIEDKWKKKEDDINTQHQEEMQKKIHDVRKYKVKLAIILFRARSRLVFAKFVYVFYGAIRSI